MKTWFSLYYVAPADSRFYQLGSAVLGYDVRASTSISRVFDIPEAWVEEARPFGFHMTITEALTCDPDALGTIEDDIEAVLGAFSPESDFRLEQPRLEHWRDGEVWVLRYHPSRALELFQAVMVSRLARFGKDSMFFDEIEKHPERYSAPYEQKRLELFLSPRGLDTWRPHFTLLNPHPKRANPDLATTFEEHFLGFEPLNVATVCLLCREGEGAWQLRREFSRSTPA